MKIEVRKLESYGSDNPFRVTVWAVLRNGKVCAFCFTPEVAAVLEKGAKEFNTMESKLAALRAENAALEEAERYAQGHATANELAAARDAWDAAWAAQCKEFRRVIPNPFKP